MDYELKPLAAEAIPKALEKAERYRLLNEPSEAESICLDILEIEPDNQEALVILLLARTDLFERRPSGGVERAQELLPRLAGDYEKAYYAGIICEREAKALLKQWGPRTGPVAYEWLQRAMEHFEQAAAIRPPGNDDAILRWNTCARLLMRNPKIAPEPEMRAHPTMLE